MVCKDFKINKKVFRKRKASTLQHKLRVIMKCYTVTDFVLDDDAQSFTFKKTHKINGLKMNDPKEYSGRFEVEDIDENRVILKLIIGEKKDADK
ncbi:MAG: hypothetical protein AABY15_08920 [Nanoarchaeota archaeon]